MLPNKVQSTDMTCKHIAVITDRTKTLQLKRMSVWVPLLTQLLHYTLNHIF